MKSLCSALPKLILASQSPARKRILEDEGINVIVLPTHTDETISTPCPQERVRLLSLRKLQTFLSQHAEPSLPVLCCDTLVIIDGRFIGKAKDRTEAYDQLSLFSGRRQSVASGWALYRGGRILSGSDEAFVTFRPLTKDEIETYLDTGEWMGAAGSYRIQEAGSRLVSLVEGDINTVVGLPLLRIKEALL